MHDDRFTQLATRPPEDLADAFYRDAQRVAEPAPADHWAELGALPPRPRFSRRVLAGLGHGLRFACYCTLRFIRPLVVLAFGFLTFICLAGALVLYFMYQAPLTRVLAVGAMGVGCVAVRAGYDSLLMHLAPDSVNY